MEKNNKNLRLILGIKLRQFRQQRDFSLKELAEKAKVSVSYLSEIEKGKKYPTPEKIMQLAEALGVSFDELVTLKVNEELNPLTTILDSPLLHEFPFQIFGIEPRAIVDLVKSSPLKAGALLRTLVDIGQNYDMKVEQFLFAALRSYLKMHENYFEEIEKAAQAFIAAHQWATEPPLPLTRLQEVLVHEYHYQVDEKTLHAYPELQGFRSIRMDSNPPRLLLNGKLMPVQKAFIIGRELGYSYLNLKERATTSSWLMVESFEEVLNNALASYFSGALLLNRDLLVQDLTAFFHDTRWEGEALLRMMQRYGATPEMFFYRLSQLLPKLFGLKEMFYLRFNNVAGSEEYTLTKELNMSRVLVPHGIGLNEHYCRRWLTVRLLKELAESQKRGAAGHVLVGAQRSRFIDSDAEFFVITMTRSLALTEHANSSITLGFLLNDDFKKTVRFWDDPAIPLLEVNETCERCGLSSQACRERAAPPVIYEKKREQRLREQALQKLMVDLKA
ncbi:MAG: helix-turn-helix domain-containing protein [bacterium]